MSCRAINKKYISEGYIIKYVEWNNAFTKKANLTFPNPEDVSLKILQDIFDEIELNKAFRQAIIQQYTEINIWNEANIKQREILAPQVKIAKSFYNLPEIFYPKFSPLIEENLVWQLNEQDLQVYLGTRLQWFNIPFNEYKQFIDNVKDLCDDFNLREDDILLNPSNIGYHPILGLRIIDYGLTNT